MLSGATTFVWTPDLLRGLAQGRQVITFDNAGMGLSTDTSGNFSVEYDAPLHSPTAGSTGPGPA